LLKSYITGTSLYSNKMFGQNTSYINSVQLCSFGRQMTDTEVYAFCFLLRIRETVSPRCHLWLPWKQTHTHTRARASYAFVAKATRLILHRL